MKWKDMPWLCPQYLKQSTVHGNSYQNPNDVFHRNRTKNPKTCLESEKTPNSQSNPKKKEKKTGVITRPGFKLYYQVTIIKTP